MLLRQSDIYTETLDLQVKDISILSEKYDPYLSINNYKNKMPILDALQT